jgi:hypothetical protein
MTRDKAFRQLGTKLKNPRRDLSARSTNGGTVAVSLWKDEIRGPAGRMVCSRSGWGNWNRSTYRGFLKNLAWALEHCGGIVRVVIVVRAEENILRVRTADCYPAKNLLMRVTHLDLVAGAFGLEQVIPGNFAMPAHHPQAA